MEALAESLKHNATLTQLGLGSGNQLNGIGLHALALSLEGNSRSRVVRLAVHEESAALDTRVELIFAMSRAVLATEHTEASAELNIGSLLHGRRLPRGGGEGHTAPSQRTLSTSHTKNLELPPLSGAKAIQFYKGPLTFCVQSLFKKGPRNLSELAKALIADRLRRADHSYVHAADAQAALLEAILLPRATDRQSMLEAMIGAGSKGGLRRVMLRDQSTQRAALTPTAKSDDSIAAHGGSSFTQPSKGVTRKHWRESLDEGATHHAVCARKGELWMLVADKTTAQPTGESSKPPAESPSRRSSSAIAQDGTAETVALDVQARSPGLSGAHVAAERPMVGCTGTCSGR